MSKIEIVSLILITFLLAACTAAPSPAAIGTAIAETQAAWTPVPTNTFYPTYTPYPTPTTIPSPTATATPEINSDMVIAAFKAAGLEAENPYTMVKNDYGAAPFLCAGTRFLVPSIGPDSGGRIFICGSQVDQDALAEYYNSLGRQSALFFSWVFTKGQVLVQINGNLPEATALQYEAAIP